MRFDPDTAAIRFGTGLGPSVGPPASVRAMLARLAGPDDMAARFPIPVFSALLPDIARFGGLQKQRKMAPDQARKKALQREIRNLRRTAREGQAHYLRAAVARSVYAPDGFRERLTQFWANHFTVQGKGGLFRSAVSTYVEEAIRPNLAGSFSALVTAVVTHPMMLLYLDQANSAGPGSRLAQRRAGRGLNENLARELLELHTLGVDGGYTQKDVRQLAELFTGMSVAPDKGFVFRPAMSEPGAETVLGKSYGGGPPGMQDIRAFLGDLAIHPDTARHISWKLARHFVADDPDAALVDHLARRFSQTGGNLSEVYAALLDHPAAWVKTDRKTKPPFDFIVSALRAIDVDERRLTTLTPRATGLYIATPMQVMGQKFEAPTGPDGWPEEGPAWITPQGIAGRIQWAMSVPRVVRPDLPDPRVFLEHALGRRASKALGFAAGAAATKWEGVGLILASPEFQRR